MSDAVLTEPTSEEIFVCMQMCVIKLECNLFMQLMRAQQSAIEP